MASEPEEAVTMSASGRTSRREAHPESPAGAQPAEATSWDLCLGFYVTTICGKAVSQPSLPFARQKWGTGSRRG